MLRSRPILGCLLLLLIVMVLAAIHRPFISDELHEAWTVLGLLKKTPYAEELYYKNVLGYYLKLPFLLILKSWWASLVLSRIVLALVLVGTMAAVVHGLRNRYTAPAICAGLLLFTAYTENITHGTSYRVDMLAAAAGVFSFLLLTRRRLALAGVLAGVSFLISQKGVYYCVSGFLALLALTRAPKDLARYVLAGVATGAAYVAFWWCFAPLGVVLHTIFVKDTLMATAAGYEIQHYWLRTIWANPIFWLASLFSLAYLFQRPRDDFEKSLLWYVGALLLQASLSGQPWPYTFIFLTPLLFITVCDFFQRLIDWERPRSLQALILGLGLIISYRHLVTENTLTNDYQRYNVELMESILKDGDTYLAGFNLLPNKEQAHPDFLWLNAINRRALAERSEVDKNRLLAELRARPPKLILYNYRFDEFDPYLRKEIFKDFEHLWANLYVYSIKATEKTRTVDVKFAGDYVLAAPAGAVVFLEGKPVPIGSQVRLKQRSFAVRSSTPFTLKLIPEQLQEKLIADYYRPRDLKLTYEY